MPRTVAVVSAGDMGSGVGRLLVQGGSRVVTWLGGRSQRTRRRAEDAGMEELADLAAVVREADVLLSIVPPAHALDLARAVGPQPDLLYVDCNAVSPATVRQVADVIGQHFVDVGIIGAPAAPRLYASGPQAPELASLGLDTRFLGDQVGDASGLKMCYAAFTKGLTALATELLAAGDRLGLAEPLRAELEDSQPMLYSWSQRAIPGMVPKAYRWIVEMEEIAATFAALGLTPKMLEGAAEVYRLVESGLLPAGFVRPDEQVADRRR
jgi:3-hydroxyisobutyrate dehydrogenase-like beta-hydroxyacid dehydrogenase